MKADERQDALHDLENGGMEIETSSVGGGCGVGGNTVSKSLKTKDIIPYKSIFPKWMYDEIKEALQPSPTDAERQAALDDLNEWLKSGAERTWDEVADILFTHRRTILAALQTKSEKTSLSSTSPVRDTLSSQTEAACAVRVPVIEGLDEAIDMVEKWYHGNQSALKTGPYIQFVRVIKYARAYAELSKTKQSSQAAPQKGV